MTTETSIVSLTYRVEDHSGRRNELARWMEGFGRVFSYRIYPLAMVNLPPAPGRSAWAPRTLSMNPIDMALIKSRRVCVFDKEIAGQGGDGRQLWAFGLQILPDSNVRPGHIRMNLDVGSPLEAQVTVAFCPCCAWCGEIFLETAHQDLLRFASYCPTCARARRPGLYEEPIGTVAG